MLTDFLKKEEGKLTPLALLAEVSACEVSHGALCKNRELTCCVTGRRRARVSASASHADGFRKTSRQLGVSTTTKTPRSPHRTWQPASSSSSSFFFSLAATKLNPAEQHHVLYFYVGPRLFWKRLNGSKNTYITGAGGESSSCVYITVPEFH